MSFSSWLNLVKPIVRDAGLNIRRHLFSGRPPAARQKAEGGWVTDLDLETEEFLAESLRRCFPDHGIIGEETGQSGDMENCWVIDPLDGTTNFVHGYPQCAVSVAFCRRGRPEIGLVHDIANDDLYFAALGDGARVNDERIRVSPTVSFSRSLFILGGQINPDLTPLLANMAARCDGMRRLGATALDMAWLAAGRADALVSGPVNYWDVAAGAVLVREAGGLLSDLSGNTEFVFNAKTETFVAATPRVFAKFFTEAKAAVAEAAGR